MISSWELIISLIDTESITKDRIGKWIMLKIKKEKKAILVIYLY